MADDAWLGRAAVGVTAACVLVLAATAAANLPAVRSALGFLPAATPAYRVGERVDVPAALYESAPATLLVFVRAGCAACQRAAPALVELIREVSTDAGAAVVALIGAGRDPEDLAFAAALGLAEAQVAAVDFTALRLRVVPTVLVSDAGGRVRLAVEGEPGPQDREAARRLLAPAAPAAR